MVRCGLRSFAAALLACVVMGSADGVLAEDAEEVEFSGQLIHSDLPIYTFNWEDLWPRSFIPEGSIAGCTSRVRFGDWEFTPNPADPSGLAWWLRVRNYGVFHCGAILEMADEREELAEADYEYGFFVRIDYEDSDNPEREFWVLQQGTRPGSNYVLLARDIDEDLVERFTALQRRCPIGAYREVTNGMDVWSTGYCAINSHEDLYRLANQMAKLLPLGELVLRSDPDAEKTPESEQRH